MLREHFSPKRQRAWRRGEKFLKGSEIYVWLDIFGINQRPGAHQQSDIFSLKEVVKDAKQTCMVLDR